MARATNERIVQHLNRPRPMPEGIRERAEQYVEQTGEMVREYPWASAATMFAAGLGVGLGMAMLVFKPEPRRQTLQHNLSNAVAHALPTALKRYFR